MIGEFFSGGDTALRFYIDGVGLFVELGVAIRSAGMIDISREMLAPAAVEDEALPYRKEIHPAAPISFVFAESRPSVFDDEIVFLSGNGGEEAEPGA